MAVKRFKPVTPGTRFRVDVSNSDITTNVPEKSLVVSATQGQAVVTTAVK
jgi:large subunit ribosomal protein L2